MFTSKMSAVGEAGVSKANGTLVVRAEVSFRTGFVPVSVPRRDEIEPEFPTSNWFAVKPGVQAFAVIPPVPMGARIPRVLIWIPFAAP